MNAQRHRRSLRTRLVVSHTVVVAAGAVAMLAVSAIVTREVYGRRLRNGTGRASGAGAGSNGSGGDAQLRALLDDALWPALVAGVAAALAVGLLAAWWISRRITRPIDDLRAATRRLAAGDFESPVPEPADSELADLANDIRGLGTHLAGTERRRAHLLAEVTHELRTPLTVIRGHMEALLDDDTTPSPEVFGIVADETARMQRLVDDLALLSRADEGRLDLRAEQLDLAVIAAEAVRRLGPQFEFAGVGLVAAELAPAPARGDPDRLMQVVANLVGNALGHTPAGGTVTIATRPDGERSTLTVADDGAGISAADLPHIFDRFYRAAGASAPSPGRAGRGLGLTIARSLARAHGGDVSAVSAGPGHGASFTMWLPRAASPPAAAQ